jgi:threonine dehydratase
LNLHLADILAARRAISGIVVRTPLVASPHMSAIAGHDFLLKLETTQPIGAFKLRGAVNAVFGLAPEIAGVTCCSTGNHGRGVAYAARARGLKAVICMSSLVPPAKVDGIRALGADVRIVGRSQDAALAESRRLARDQGLAEISPFDDTLVIAGQGTIGLELMEDRPDLAAILVPLSGGGLAAGVALAVKAIKPSIRVIGITMERGAAMHDSIRAGRPVEVEEVPSLADSLGGGIGAANRWTFGLCRDLIDQTVLVTEQEIRRGMTALFRGDRLVTEGGGAVGAAALLAGKLTLDGPTALIVSGRNVDMDVFLDIVTGRPVKVGDLEVAD